MSEMMRKKNQEKLEAQEKQKAEKESANVEID